MPEKSDVLQGTLTLMVLKTPARLWDWAVQAGGRRAFVSGACYGGSRDCSCFGLAAGEAGAQRSRVAGF